MDELNKPTEAPKAPDATPKEGHKHNNLARTAFTLAILAQVSFFLAAFVPLKLSWILAGVCALLAVTAFVTGLVSLRHRPRNLSVGALVFSGVLIIIGIILVVGYNLVQNMINAPTA